MAEIELAILGYPELRAGGRPVRLHSSKTLALLAFLALESARPHSRERLAALLWGSSSDTLARKSLRQALYSLRHALGPIGEACLRVDAGTVSFQPHTQVWIDAVELRQLAADDLVLLRRAVQLCRGPLLDGLFIDDCPELDEWLFFQRDVFDQRSLDAREALAAGLIAQGVLDEALAVAQELLARDPLREAAYRQLMQIAAAQGSRERIVHQYRRCAEALARELGMEPSQETRALYHALIAEPLPPVAAPPQGHLPALPLVGRTRELQVMQARLDDARAGRGGLLLITGEAGSGKTRLITTFRVQAAMQHTAIIWLAGRCYAAESRTPYMLWSDVLRPLASPEWRHVTAHVPPLSRQHLARLVPALGEPPPSDVGGADERRVQLLQAVVDCLVLLTHTSPVVLILEDLHWADEATIELLHYVARQLQAATILIIGSYRPEEVAGRQLIRRATAAGNVVEPLQLPLNALKLRDVGELLKSFGSVSAELIAQLHRHSEGNPLLLVETLRMLTETGWLRISADGRLQVAGSGAWPIPQPVAELIRDRVALVSVEQRRALIAAAVIGRACDLRLLRRISGLSEPQLLDAFERLCERGVLGDGAEPHTVTFAHAYLRQVIYDDLPRLQRQVFHRRIAEALVSIHPQQSATAEEIASHYERADDPRAIPYMLQAARRAAELNAYAHATDLYSRALELCDTAPDVTLIQRFDLLLARETTLDRQGRRAEQAADIAALAALAHQLDDRPRLAEVWMCEAGFYTYTGRHIEARQRGEQALALYDALADQAGTARALRELGFLHWAAGDYTSALDYGRMALELHRRRSDSAGEATALHNLAEIYRSLGSPGQAVALYQQALRLQWSNRDQRGQGMALYGLAQARRQLGDRLAARQVYQQALDACRSTGDRLMSSRVHHELACQLWEDDDRTGATAHVHEALSISRTIGYVPGIAHGLLLRSTFEAGEGQHEAAEATRREAEDWLQFLHDLDVPVQVRYKPPDDQSAEPVSRSEWVKSHVALAEGKVYCAFESPAARSS